MHVYNGQCKVSSTSPGPNSNDGYVRHGVADAQFAAIAGAVDSSAWWSPSNCCRPSPLITGAELASAAAGAAGNFDATNVLI